MNAWTTLSAPGAGGRPPGCTGDPRGSFSPPIVLSPVSLQPSELLSGAPIGRPRARWLQSGGLILALPPSEELSVQEMVIYGVSFDMVGKQPIVLLKTVENNKFLPIWIGHPEAAAILMKLQGASTPRPMTHDLLSDMLGELDVECTRVAVTELRENTFYASISLRVNGRELEIDSRPSDALALAVRAGAPIFAADEVIAESAIEFEHEVEDTEEVVEKFKDFLDQVTPEDFAAGDS
jgi:bifunctional DNase/RNase